jgi:hypothetical protein
METELYRKWIIDKWYKLRKAKDWRQLTLTSDDKETKSRKLVEQHNKAIKSLTDYKESDLPVSAIAEYSTFVAGIGESTVELRYQDEKVWLI